MTRGRAGVHRALRVGACLSLSGEYARFGTQAARGLEAWQSLDGAAELIIADDRSDPGTLHAALPQIAAQCDVLLGPYSTRLARVAGRLAARAGWLLWNHGGAGDDVETAHPGHVVSVLAPASRYAAPFLRHLAATGGDVRLWIAHGRGSFGKQLAAGAEASARQAGIRTARLDRDGRDGALPPPGPPGPWDLFSAGSFEEDVDMVERARAARQPPRVVCAVAAGVREFGAAGLDTRGVFGVGQWFPGAAPAPELGPAEAAFLAAYRTLTGAVPDYPAVQAAAAAALAAHCTRQAGGSARDLLWAAALALDTRTMFGGFRIRPADGLQVGHEAVLVRWSAQGPSLIEPGTAPAA